MGRIVRIFSMLYKVQYRVLITLLVPTNAQDQSAVRQNVLKLLMNTKDKQTTEEVEKAGKTNNVKSWDNFMTFIAFDDSNEDLKHINFDITIHIPANIEAEYKSEPRPQEYGMTQM